MSAIGTFLRMPALKSLDLTWRDIENVVASENENLYMENWDLWQIAFYDITWRNLECLRLIGFKPPDELLAPFVLKHAPILRNLSLIRCRLACTPSTEDFS